MLQSAGYRLWCPFQSEPATVWHGTIRNRHSVQASARGRSHGREYVEERMFCATGRVIPIDFHFVFLARWPFVPRARVHVHERLTAGVPVACSGAAARPPPPGASLEADSTFMLSRPSRCSLSWRQRDENHFGLTRAKSAIFRPSMVKEGFMREVDPLVNFQVTLEETDSERASPMGQPRLFSLVLRVHGSQPLPVVSVLSLCTVLGRRRNSTVSQWHSVARCH